MARSCLLVYSFLAVALHMGAQEVGPIVKKIRVLTDNGGRIDWSKQNKIAFDRKGSDGFYEIWVVNPDGTDEHCLTCNQPEAPTKHKGNPAWDPSGKYIVFEGEKDRASPLVKHLAAPGRGVANDLWLMDASGHHYWKLADVPRFPAGGVLHPHFSSDGKMLTWGQLVRSSGVLGIWQMKVARFEVVDGNPQINDIRTFTPGAVKKFFETHDFSPHDREILYTAQVSSGLSDIFEMDLSNEQIKDLTNTPNDWDEHAHYSPDGRSIVWASSRNEPTTHSLNLWTMDRDGSHARELLNFHTSGKPGYTQGVGPADSSWSPDGRALAVYVITDDKENQGAVWILEF